LVAACLEELERCVAIEERDLERHIAEQAVHQVAEHGYTDAQFDKALTAYRLERAEVSRKIEAGDGRWVTSNAGYPMYGSLVDHLMKIVPSLLRRRDLGDEMKRLRALYPSGMDVESQNKYRRSRREGLG
jgi:hypothetical protein